MKTKRLFAMFLTFVMVMSLFAGCETGTDPDTGTTAPAENIVESIGETTETTAPETEVPTEQPITELDETEIPTEETEAPTLDVEETKPATCQHDYKSETVKPTCTKAGYTEKTCTKCGHVVKTDEKSALGHNYTSKVTTAATCTADGVKTYTCGNCGHSYTERIAAKHDYECTDTRPATCSNTGDKTYTCKNCGHSYKETLPKNEHKWSEWTVTIEPTTTSYGKKVRTCELCHGGQEVNIDPLPADETEPVHQHSYSSKVTKAATCTEDGVKTFTCSCGSSYTEAIAKTGHSWGGWKVTKEATTETEGEESRTCSACGKTETRKTDKLPADDGDEVITDCNELGLSHTMSAADAAKITRGDNYYKIVCRCGRGCVGSDRDAALAKFNAHAAEKQYDYCGEIMHESEHHYHNVPFDTVVCTVCGKTVKYNRCTMACWGTGHGECPYG